MAERGHPQAAEDLESEAFYRVLFEEARDGIVVAGADGVILAANRSMVELLGYAPRELVGRHLRFLLRPCDHPLLEGPGSPLGDGITRLREWTVLRKDGGLVEVEAAGQRLPDGRLVGWVRDLSGRRAADAALRDSETRLRATLMNTPGVAVQWYDESGRVVFWNPASERMFGYSAAEAVGKTLDALIHTPEELAAFVAALRQVHEEGNPTGPSEFEFRRRDGTRGVCLSTVFEIPGAEGRPWFVCMDVDITARMDAERRLRESETRFRSYFELPLVGLAVTSPDKGWVEVNDRLCEILGYTREELRGLTWAQLTHPDDLAADLAQFERVRRGEIEGYVLDKRFLRKGGAPVDSTLSVRCARKADGSVDYFTALILDVTDRRRMEEHLRQAQKVESIGRLAGGVAHDFNNLLTSILGFAELARRSVTPGSPEEKYLDSVLDAGRRGAALTQQLLAFARRKIVSLAPADLNEVVARVRPLLGRLLGEDIRLDLALSPGLGIVRVDTGSLEQVLVNMAVNARDAMPRGGRLRLETRNVELGAEDLRDQPEAAAGPHVEVAVADTGEGMGPETLARLFEPFFTTKAPGKGTGLGLAMCHGIVRQAGGHIVVESRPGQGSTFRIRFPRIAEEAVPLTAPPAPAPRSRGSETLLIVEDDEMVRELARQVLLVQGYRVLVAHDGPSALAAARAEGPVDLLLTDVVMPGMSGRDLASRLLEIQPSLKVLYASGYPEDVLGPHGALDPSVRLLGKPYAPDLLVARIREVLDSP